MQSKSKKGGPSQKVATQPQPKVPQNVQQPTLLSNVNAQQQMASNVQNQIFQVPQSQFFPVQQVPQSFNQPIQLGNMNNAMFQQQQQAPIFPPQMSYSNTVQQQQVRGGLYGRPNHKPNPEKQPDVFNDDEALV